MDPEQIQESITKPPAEDSTTNYKTNYCQIYCFHYWIICEWLYLCGVSFIIVVSTFHLVTDLLGFVVSFVFLCFAKKT